MANGKMARRMVSSETRESERIGRGVLKFSFGAVYDGEWKGDKQHGKFRDAGE